MSACTKLLCFHLFGSDIEFVLVFTSFKIFYMYETKHYEQLNIFSLSFTFVLRVQLECT